MLDRLDLMIMKKSCQDFVDTNVDVRFCTFELQALRRLPAQRRRMQPLQPLQARVNANHDLTHEQLPVRSKRP